MDEANRLRDPLDLAQMCDEAFGPGGGDPIRDLVDSNQTWSEVSARVCQRQGVDSLIRLA
jgi:hypothetical protein